MRFLHSITQPLNRHRTLIPSPEQALTRNVDRLVILCGNAYQANEIQRQQAAPTLRQNGLVWAQDGRYRLADGRLIEFLSAQGSLWWSRLYLSGLRTVVVPLYRHDPGLDYETRSLVESRLRIMNHLVTVLDVPLESL